MAVAQVAVHLLVVVAVQALQNRLHVRHAQTRVVEVAQGAVQLVVQVVARVTVQAGVLEVADLDVVRHVLANAKANVLANVPQVAIEVTAVAGAVAGAQVLAQELAFNTAQEDAIIHVMILVLAHVKTTAVLDLVRVLPISDNDG